MDRASQYGDVADFSELSETECKRLIAVADAGLVLPALADAALGGRLKLPNHGGLFAYLEEVRALAKARSDTLDAVCRSVVATLNRAGIVPTLIKGAGRLYDDLYPSPLWRHLRDLDILVRPDEVAAAWQALTEAGYEPQQIGREDLRKWFAYQPYDRHQAPPLGPPGLSPLVDLHRRPLSNPTLSKRLFAGYRERLEPATIAPGCAVTRLAKRDQMVLLIAHRLFSDQGLLDGEVPARYALEARLLSRQLSKDDWAAVQDRFAAAGRLWVLDYWRYLLAEPAGKKPALPPLVAAEQWLLRKTGRQRTLKFVHRAAIKLMQARNPAKLLLWELWWKRRLRK